MQIGTKGGKNQSGKIPKSLKIQILQNVQKCGKSSLSFMSKNSHFPRILHCTD